LSYRLYTGAGRCSPEVVRERLGVLPEIFVVVAEAAPREGEVALLHCPSHGVPARWSGKLVYTVHDLSFFVLPSAHTLYNATNCAVALARAVARGAELVAISAATRAELCRVLEVPESAVALAPPGVDARFAPQPEAVVAALRERYLLPQGYVLFVGTREPRKNLTTLLAAHRLLPAPQREAHPLVLVGGDGWGTALALEGDSAVRTLGVVDERDLPALYTGASVLAYPSLYEGFGLPVLEAMACGTPVAVGDHTSLPEVTGDAATVVDVRDPASVAEGIALLLGDRERAERQVRAGLERARRFPWSATAQAMREIYLGLLGDRRRSG
jgi:glycosyltransferase involved in cell wall biosynthesis